MTDEKRRFSRVPFDAKVLISQGDKEWHADMHDISLNGLLVSTPKEWNGAPGEHFHIELIFANSSSLIHGDAEVAHTEEGRIGFRMINIDVESVTHLRRLMELNLGNSELLNRELSALQWQ